MNVEIRISEIFLLEKLTRFLLRRIQHKDRLALSICENNVPSGRQAIRSPAVLMHGTASAIWLRQNISRLTISNLNYV